MSRSAHALTAVALVVLTLITYSPIWTAAFVYEDQSSIIDTTIWTHAPIAPLRARALTRASYKLDNWIGKGQPWAFHADNLALHLVNGALVGVIAANLLVPPAGWVAATMFLLHPLNSEAVAYGAGRTEVLSTCFALLTLLLLIKGKVWWAPVTFVLALSAKESAIALAPLLLWYALLYREGVLVKAQSLRLWSRSFVPLVLAGLGAGWIAQTVILKEYLVQADMPLWRYFLVQATAFWRYVWMVPTLYGQSAEHPFDVLPFWLQGLAGLALVWFLCMIPLVWLANDLMKPSKRRMGIVFALGWIAFALLPRFVMRIPEILNEHQVYLWSVGWCLLIAAVWTSRKEWTDAAPA